MAINDAYWATLTTPGGTGGRSGTISWRFPSPLNITAQAAINGYGAQFSFPAAEVGFSGYVQDGAYHAIGDGGWGSWASVVFLDRVTQVDVSIRSNDNWVHGSAVAYVWE